MQGSERAIFLLASIAAIAGVLFGFDEGVIAGALHLLRIDFSITPVSEGFMTAAVPLGALMGAIVAGRLADPVGRRSLLIAAAALFCLGALFAALAGSMSMLTVARLVLGLAIGVAGVMAPLYIAESVPPARRGMLVSVYQLAITIGILSAYGVNLAFSESWRLMFACGILPGLALFFGMVRMSDSPRWLVQKGRDAQAQQALARLGGTTADDPAVTIERERIARAVKADQHLNGGFTDLFTARVRPALIVAVGLFALQQLCGINAVIYYAPTIFAHAGFDSTGTQLMATIGIGVVNVAMTIVGMMLIDRLGRRRLLLGGFAGAAASLALIAFAAASSHPSSPLWAMARCRAVHRLLRREPRAVAACDDVGGVPDACARCRHGGGLHQQLGPELRRCLQLPRSAGPDRADGGVRPVRSGLRRGAGVHHPHRAGDPRRIAGADRAASHERPAAA